LAVINRNNYYFLCSTTEEPYCEHRDSDPFIFYYRDFDDANDYYYIEIKDGEALGRFTLRSLVDWDLILKIRDPNDPTYLMICNSHEAFDSIVEPIYKHVVLSHHIPPEKVIVVSGSFDLAETVEAASDKFQRGKLKAELCMDFEAATKHTFLHFESEFSRKFEIPETLVYKPYPKKFINFNRRWRPARPTFVGLLIAYGLIDQGYVSLAPSDCGNKWPDYWQNLIHINHMFDDVLELLKKHRGEIINMPPLYLDTNDLVTNRAYLMDDTSYLYEQTYFSLIAETNYYTCHEGFEKSRFFSEKAFKPIVFKHPHIFISTPKMVSAMKQIGYQSFDPLINEDYDNIENDGDRMLAILEETKRLCNLSNRELKDFLGGCREICDYNHNAFLSKTQFTHRLNY